jgi:predicted ABC-type ATPase
LRLHASTQEAGYVVELIFLSLPDPETAISRVAARVAQGGHSVPEPVIHRRFATGLVNFHGCYKHLVNNWQLYDNANIPPALIDEGSSS